MRHEPELRVDTECGRVVVRDLDLNRLAPPCATLLEELVEQRTSDPSPPECGPNEQIINVAAETAIFHGVPEGEHRMPDRLLARACKPGAAPSRGCQQGDEGRRRPATV